MKLPKVSSFFWIGLILLVIGIYAQIKGSAFRFDAGVPPEPHEALYYIITGVVMIVNGLVHPLPSDEEKQASQNQREEAQTKPA